MHQPAGNLGDLLGQREWEAREILWAMDRIPRSLWAYEDVGRVHLSLSGTLPETLASPGFQRRAYGIVDCGSLLWYLQNTTIICILGTGYYHPVLSAALHRFSSGKRLPARAVIAAMMRSTAPTMMPARPRRVCRWFRWATWPGKNAGRDFAGSAK